MKQLFIRNFKEILISATVVAVVAITSYTFIAIFA